MTIRQVLGKAVSFFSSKPEVACALQIAGSKPGYTALHSQQKTVVKLSVVLISFSLGSDLATVNDSVCVGAHRKASLNRCRGECIAILSPTVVEVAVLLLRMID